MIQYEWIEKQERELKELRLENARLQYELDSANTKLKLLQETNSKLRGALGQLGKTVQESELGK